MKRTAERKERRRPERSVFSTILLSLLAVLVVEVLMLTVSIVVSQVPQQLDQNAEDILAKQVENRSGYLEDRLVESARLGDLAKAIDGETQRLLQAGTIHLDSLDRDSEKAAPLFEAVAEDLIATLRSKSVTGIFVALDTHDIADWTPGVPVPGVYLRDLDPNAPPSQRNEDLSFERAPAALLKNMRIATSTTWRPAMNTDPRNDQSPIMEPLRAAWEDGASLPAAEYGRWTTVPYHLAWDPRTAVAYSQPLILPDGTIYGVVGIELLTSYLETLMPYQELQNDGSGTYLLASTTTDPGSGTLELTTAVSAGPDGSLSADGTAALLCQTDDAGQGVIEADGRTWQVSLESLTLYDRNAPFSGERWMLVGAVPSTKLFEFSSIVQRLMMVTILLTLAVGLGCSLLVSRQLARPIARLSAEVAAAQKEHDSIPRLSHTGVRELDRFAGAITRLSRDVVNTSTKFLRIMDMASVELGGYELRMDEESVYVTANFFSMLGMPEVDPKGLDLTGFRARMAALAGRGQTVMLAEGGCLLQIAQPEGGVRYVQLRITTDGDAEVGLIEDVTAATLERMRIEHERDYDVLTDLYGRQAFQRECEELFRAPEKLRHAAVLMMDLDGLKHVNDFYGHDWGDRYIRQTGRCLAENTPERTICARQSGDEFLAFFYGYPDRASLRKALDELTTAFRESAVVLPDGQRMPISVSGGIAWYPENGSDLATLKRYADFAMYQVKRTQKGRIEEFDIKAYDQEAYELQIRQEFRQMLEEEALTYHFQPIFTAADGRVAAYEALMRPTLPTLRSPATVMRIARELDRLYEIEHITLFHATKRFHDLLAQGMLEPEAKLFVNSIASVSLNDEDAAEYTGRWPELMRHLVVEITEEEKCDSAALARKREAIQAVGGVFALDDYGSGYGNSGSLLELSPQYVKADQLLIRNIDRDPDKQQIVSSLVAYAHPRGMKIVAEGIETAAELRKVIELGVDLLQGYYLARPREIPDPISPEAREEIRKIAEER
ncbi:GGDEF and EAL domain-containing protein [Pseudoflavonifractor sp. MSJ-37]|uniref:GGDEF and EAL domain-containing protein n=1 Tax=Pseudoflavonifractor sp. MSJ-37 TaxID=2841531 RepID=UPI001C124BE7|nr:GGDEF and EAL domain-containing protein [Pseudoflavonifractor sp. MSJ-37]MBU5435596.1 GGDEF and EAL domain-containing protein [Pseudoflavonifractor sp. MSJ-37]